ncbi:hypothetical protein ACF1G0_22470 [Streptomyces sp. NPDC013953]|uniref:hypothetical protein n=1 Tax=Streptomyces sp. NPDC013953 TaxID=3364868 RepID=UPI0036FB3269
MRAAGKGAAFEAGQEVFGTRRPATVAGHPHGSYAEYMTASRHTYRRPPALKACSSWTRSASP